MKFSFACDNCGVKLKATRDLVGRTKNCPQCGQPFTVPSPPADELVEDGQAPVTVPGHGETAVKARLLVL